MLHPVTTDNERNLTMDNRDECEHDHTTEILFDAKINQHMRSERKYEVAYCTDCNRMVNYYQNVPMSGDEIIQMFKDIKSSIIAIEYEKDALKEVIEDTLKAFKGL
jgi:TRAP-type mannitol/chloroaromatic compound transport system substrate-binding protein